MKMYISHMQAILLLRRVFSLGAHPSTGDLKFLVDSFTSETSHLAVELENILDAHSITLDDSIEFELRLFTKSV